MFNMRWLPFVNLILVIVIGLSIIGIVFSLSGQRPHVELIPVACDKQLPKRPFDAPQLDTLHQGPLALQWTEPTLELPNLSQLLHYHSFRKRGSLFDLFA